MDHQGQDLDAWDKVVEKAKDAKVNVNLQSSFYIREIDSKCPRGIARRSKRTRKMPIGSTAMRLPIRTKKKLCPIIPLLLIKLRPRLLKSVK